jgi:hypothetical protein
MGGSQPPDEGVMYWGYDEPRGRFKTYFFNDQGAYDSDLSSYEGEVVDNRLVFTGGACFSHALDHDGTWLSTLTAASTSSGSSATPPGLGCRGAVIANTPLTERSPGTLSGQRSTKADAD